MNRPNTLLQEALSHIILKESEEDSELVQTRPAVERIAKAIQIFSVGGKLIALHGVRLREDGGSGLRCTCEKGRFSEFLADGSDYAAYCSNPGAHPVENGWKKPYCPGDKRLRGYTTDPEVVKQWALAMPFMNFGCLTD